MLRIHRLHSWFSLSNPVMEEAPYEIISIRQLARRSAPQSPKYTTIMKFRHPLEKYQLAFMALPRTWPM
jgi:IS5 family transposase